MFFAIAGGLGGIAAVGGTITGIVKLVQGGPHTRMITAIKEKDNKKFDLYVSFNF